MHRLILKTSGVITLLVLCGAISARAGFVISSGGKAKCVIVQSTEASEPEITAARELSQTLRQITGAGFEVQTNQGAIPQHAIIVGPGATASQLFPEVDLTRFGPEEYVMRTKGGHLLLAGGKPRGTLYALNRFLQEQCGGRWW